MTSNWGEYCTQCTAKMRKEPYRYTMLEMGEQVVYEIHYCRNCDLFHWMKIENKGKQP